MATLVDTAQSACFAERIAKENESRYAFDKKWGGSKKIDMGWRPIEPFEPTSSSSSPAEMPPRIPVTALTRPDLYRDSVGDEGLAGGTPKRFGGRWDCASTLSGTSQDDSPSRKREVKKGPHDCYCEIGFGCFSQTAQARPENHGRISSFKREFWTDTPGALAMVWQYKGKGEKGSPSEKSLAQLDEAVAKS